MCLIFCEVGEGPAFGNAVVEGDGEAGAVGSNGGTGERVFKFEGWDDF